MTKMEKAFALFDDYNKQDPHHISHGGKNYPSEYFYALQVHDWVKRLEPKATEALLLASRCQHIGRWEIPRSQYPEGRAAYFKWRTDLAKFHAEKAAGFLKEAGYDEATIEDVKRIILKQRLKLDHEVQTMENALCLVFLQYQYDDFLAQHDDEKMIRILRKTWSKMSQPGHEAALGLPYSERGKALIEKALGE